MTDFEENVQVETYAPRIDVFSVEDLVWSWFGLRPKLKAFINQIP